MCTSKSDGGKRCGCDNSEARRLRRHNREALNRVDSWFSRKRSEESPPAPPFSYVSPTFGQPVTITEMQQQAAKITGLKSKWKAATDTAEQQELLTKLKDETVHMGAMVNSMVASQTGKTDEEVANDRQAEIVGYQTQIDINESQREESQRQIGLINGKLQQKTISASQAQQDIEDQQKIGRAARDSTIALEESRRKVNEDNLIIAADRGAAILDVIRQIRPLADKVKVAGGEAQQEYSKMAGVFPEEWLTESENLNTVYTGYTKKEEGNKAGFYLENIDNASPGTRQKLASNFNLQKELNSPGHVSFIQINLQAGSREYRDALPLRVKSTHIHEYVHHLERIQGRLPARLQEEFLRERISTGGQEEKVLLHDSRKSAYYKDSFPAVHAGRDYRNKPGLSAVTENDHWEILSVGAESVFGGANDGFMNLYRQKADVHYKNFIVGFWAAL
jgi:hypothetical protein